LFWLKLYHPEAEIVKPLGFLPRLLNSYHTETMPLLTRWFIKAAMLSLIAAFLIRAAMTLWPALNAPFAPVFLHLFMWGWVTQLIFGVAYWMFPKYSKDNPHGHEGVWQATFWCFNVGLIFRVIGEPLHLLRPEALWAWLTMASAALQWLAGMAFVVNTWGRVKER
jgi:hypothetical protein